MFRRLPPEVLLLVALLVFGIGAWQQHRKLEATATVEQPPSTGVPARVEFATKHSGPFIDPDEFRPCFQFFAPADGDAEPTSHAPGIPLDCPTFELPELSALPDDDGRSSGSATSDFDFQFAKEVFESSVPQQ
jgi:hypothetical protein